MEIQTWVVRDDEFEVDVVENLTQFARAVAVSALVGTAALLRGLRKRVE